MRHLKDEMDDEVVRMSSVTLVSSLSSGYCLQEKLFVGVKNEKERDAIDVESQASPKWL